MKVVLILSLVAAVRGYSSGAPLSDEICSTLRPNHPGDVQLTKLPYQLAVDKKSVKIGGHVNYSIRSKGTGSFKGFLVQGRRVDEVSGASQVPAGTWEITENSNTLNCGGIDSSSITHKNGEPKKVVHLKWISPNTPGIYTLMYILNLIFNLNYLIICVIIV